MKQGLLLSLCITLITGCNTAHFYEYNINVDKAHEDINYIEYDTVAFKNAQDPLYHIAFPYDYSVLMYSDDYDFETTKNNSKKIVLAPFAYLFETTYKCYLGVNIYYKNKNIGKIEGTSTSCNPERYKYLRNFIPSLALCASKIGFHGTIGGEVAKDKTSSPSIEAFFNQCDIKENIRDKQ